MTAPTPPSDAEPIRRPVPRWVTDPNVADSIARGFIPLDDEEDAS